MKCCHCLELVRFSGSVATSNRSWNILLPAIWVTRVAPPFFEVNIVAEIHFSSRGQNTDVVLLLKPLDLPHPAQPPRIISAGIRHLRTKVQSNL